MIQNYFKFCFVMFCIKHFFFQCNICVIHLCYYMWCSDFTQKLILISTDFFFPKVGKVLYLYFRVLLAALLWQSYFQKWWLHFHHFHGIQSGFGAVLSQISAKYRIASDCIGFYYVLDFWFLKLAPLFPGGGDHRALGISPFLLLVD